MMLLLRIIFCCADVFVFVLVLVLLLLLLAGSEPIPETPCQAILAEAPTTTITAGSKVTSSVSGGVDAAVAAAKLADVVILAVGIDGSVEGESHDRTVGHQSYFGRLQRYFGRLQAHTRLPCQGSSSDAHLEMYLSYQIVRLPQTKDEIMRRTPAAAATVQCIQEKGNCEVRVQQLGLARLEVALA
jgi:hypothetical protein